MQLALREGKRRLRRRISERPEERPSIAPGKVTGGGAILMDGRRSPAMIRLNPNVTAVFPACDTLVSRARPLHAAQLRLAARGIP